MQQFRGLSYSILKLAPGDDMQWFRALFCQFCQGLRQ